MKIEMVAVGDLRPFAGNPRKHGEDVKGLVKSMEKFGFTNPILAQKGTGRVIAGHGRLAAAKLRGVDQVPVIYLDFDDQAADAYTITDNRTAEQSEWDVPVLKDLLLSLDDGSFDLTVTGYDEAELKKLVDFNLPAEAEQDAEAAKAELSCPNCGHSFLVDVKGKKASGKAKKAGGYDA